MKKQYLERKLLKELIAKNATIIGLTFFITFPIIFQYCMTLEAKEMIHMQSLQVIQIASASSDNIKINTENVTKKSKEALTKTTQVTIQKAKELAKEKEEERRHLEDFLARVIFVEAGGEDSDKMQQYVGYVFVNRMKAPEKYYPNTPEGVFYNKKAYAETSRQRFYKEPTKRARKNAKIVVDQYYKNTIPVPAAMVIQREGKIDGFIAYDKIENMDFMLDPNLM